MKKDKMIKFIWMSSWPQDGDLSLSLEEENIFSLVIHEKESLRPMAKVIIQNPYPHDAAHDFPKVGAIVEGGMTVFIGSVHRLEQSSHGTLTVHLIGGQTNHLPSDPQGMAALFQADDGHLFDLKVRGKYPYWSRVTGEYDETDPLKGEPYDITNDFIYDSLKVHTTAPAPRFVTMTLITEWMQRYKGETDISFKIRSLFPSGLINTLTGEALIKKWWKTGKKLGRSRYWIESTFIKEIPAPYTGVLNIYPASHRVYALSSDPVNTDYREVFLKRRWFRSRTRLGWDYRQKRREEVTLTFENPQGSPHVDPEEITFPLRRVDYNEDIWQQARGHFFITEQGQQTIHTALKLVQFHVGLMNRQEIITVVLPWDKGLTLDVNCFVALQDDRLPQHYGWGKVIDLKAELDGDTGSATVTLHVALLNEDDDTLWKKLFSHKLQETTNLQEGIDFPMALSATDIVEDARLIMGPHEQINELKESFKHYDLQDLLKKNETDIHMVLKDISSRPQLTRSYTLVPA